MKRGKAAGLVLQIANSLQVTHAMLDRVADAEHHRRGRSQTDLVHRAHHRQPFIGRAFRRHALAHFVVENLGAAAGQTVKSCVLQTRHDRFVVET